MLSRVCNQACKVAYKSKCTVEYVYEMLKQGE
jgi:hypothetical protein